MEERETVESFVVFFCPRKQTAFDGRPGVCGMGVGRGDVNKRETEITRGVIYSRKLLLWSNWK